MDLRTRIHERLAVAFEPWEVLEVIDKSAAHAGHAAVREGGGGHFEVLLVSSRFHGMTQVQRQRCVYAVLAEEMQGLIHALSMTCLTPTEYSGEP